MRIVTQLQLDLHQNPYWSSKLVEGSNVIVEVQSRVFNALNQYEFRGAIDEVNGRMMTEIFKSLKDKSDRMEIVKMLINDDKNIFENAQKDRV